MGTTPENNPSEVNTGGGVYIGKDVKAEDFVGRDKVYNTHHHYYPSPPLEDKENTQSESPSPKHWKLSETIGAALIIAISMMGTAYWVSNNKPVLPPIAMPTDSIQPMNATETHMLPTETQLPLATSTLLPQTNTPEPSYPCEASIINPDGGRQVTFLYEFKAGSTKRQVKPLSVGTMVLIVEHYIGDEVRYHIKTTEGLDFGWIPEQFLTSSSCPQISK